MVIILFYAAASRGRTPELFSFSALLSCFFLAVRRMPALSRLADNIFLLSTGILALVYEKRERYVKWSIDFI